MIYTKFRFSYKTKMDKKISIKIAYNDELRGLSIKNIQLYQDEITSIDDFHRKIREILSISSKDEIRVMKYNGNVKICLNNTSDLLNAMNIKPLCVHVNILDNSSVSKSAKSGSSSPINQQTITNGHKSPLKTQRDQVTHHSILCNYCHAIIIGNRYKCLECIDFDLCSACFHDNNNTKYTHPTDHSLLVIRSNKLKPFIHKMLYDCQKQITCSIEDNSHESTNNMMGIRDMINNNNTKSHNIYKDDNSIDSRNSLRGRLRRYSDFTKSFQNTQALVDFGFSGSILN